jgi:hypothetical protein
MERCRVSVSITRFSGVTFYEDDNYNTKCEDTGAGNDSVLVPTGGERTRMLCAGMNTWCSCPDATFHRAIAEASSISISMCYKLKLCTGIKYTGEYYTFNTDFSSERLYTNRIAQ